jgi:hypothetical protein
LVILMTVIQNHILNNASGDKVLLCWKEVTSSVSIDIMWEVK